MKIAVWLDSNYSPTDGGCFSYNSRLIKAIDNYQFPEEIEVCFATFTGHKVEGLKREVVELGYIPHVTWVEKLKCSIPVVRWHVRQCVNYRIEKERNETYQKTLRDHGIKLLYYINQFSGFIPGFPFVATHWDISFRSSFPFPELCGEEEYKTRKSYYQDFLPKALLVFTESEAGMKDLLSYTFLNKERIRIVPLFPGECTTLNVSESQQNEILRQYGLVSGKFFFYPSHLCPSKNHFTAVKAFVGFKKEHPDWKIIFTGAAQTAAYGTANLINAMTEEAGVGKDVVIAGFVSVETIYTLYKNACSLVMPSYVGSTNMPPLEAMELGCPVICSNLPGHKEEMEDAAIYFDPMSADELTSAMETMVDHRDLFVERINARAKHSPFNIDEAMKHISQYLCEAAIIRSSWE